MSVFAMGFLKQLSGDIALLLLFFSIYLEFEGFQEVQLFSSCEGLRHFFSSFWTIQMLGFDETRMQMTYRYQPPTHQGIAAIHPPRQKYQKMKETWDNHATAVINGAANVHKRRYHNSYN